MFLCFDLGGPQGNKLESRLDIDDAWNQNHSLSSRVETAVYSLSKCDWQTLAPILDMRCFDEHVWLKKFHERLRKEHMFISLGGRQT